MDNKEINVVDSILIPIVEREISTIQGEINGKEEEPKEELKEKNRLLLYTHDNPVTLNDEVINICYELKTIDDIQKQKLQLYAILNRLSTLSLNDEQKEEIKDIMGLSSKKIKDILNSVVNDTEEIKELKGKKEYLDNLMNTLKELDVRYLNSEDIEYLSNLMISKQVDTEDITKILIEIITKSAFNMNNIRKENVDNKQAPVEEITDTIEEIFAKYNYNFTNFNEINRKLILEKGNKKSISDILSILRRNNISIKISDMQDCLTQILLNSDGMIASNIIENIKEDTKKTSMNKDLSINFKEFIKRPSLFLREDNSKEFKGGYNNYNEVRKILINNGINPIDVIYRHGSIFSTSYENVLDNIEIFKLYSVPKDAYARTLTSLTIKDPAATIDQFIELNCLDALIDSFSYINRGSRDPMFYRIIKARMVGESIYSTYNYADKKALSGKITSPSIKGYGITVTNKQEVINEYNVQGLSQCDNLLKGVKCNGPIIKALSNYFINVLEKNYKVDELRYSFNGETVSRIKVLRVYEELINKGAAGTVDSIRYAIYKNSILTKEKYDKIEECLNETFKNVRGVAR